MVRAQERGGGAAVCPGLAGARARRRGLSRSYEAQLTRSIGAIRSGSGRCGWSRGWSAGCRSMRPRAMRQRSELITRRRAARADRGGAAAAWQCLCAVDCRRPTIAPAELCPLRPERVSVATDEDGWPAAYLYRAGGRRCGSRRGTRSGGGRWRICRRCNPRDDHYGLGCLGAAIAAASVHNRASRWNKALLDNAARPSGALVYEPGDGSSLRASSSTGCKRRAGASNFRERAMPGGRCCSRAG